jgi:hypothetical protein
MWIGLLSLMEGFDIFEINDRAVLYDRTSKLYWVPLLPKKEDPIRWSALFQEFNAP